MTKEELENLKRTVDYFGHWYDVIGEERIVILEKSIDYINALEQEKCELLGIIQGKDKAINELEERIEKMKCCENCGWFYLQQHWKESKEINESRMFHCGTCGNKKNWKPKEIKEK